MLRKIFSVVLLISIVLAYYYRDFIYDYYKVNILNEANNAQAEDIHIDNLVLATGTKITYDDKLWIQNFALRYQYQYGHDASSSIESIYFDQYNDVYYRMLIGELRANTKNNIDSSWNDFMSAMMDSDIKDKMKQARNDLEYLDIRFPNKLFYKFKTHEEGILGTSTEASSTSR